MTTEHEPLPTADASGNGRDPWVVAEDLIGQLPDVAGVTVLRARTGGTEIQVVVDRGTDHASVRRGIEGILSRVVPADEPAWVLTLERDRVEPSSTAVEDRPTGEALLGGRRPILRSAAVTGQDEDRPSAQVTLTIGDVEYVGRSWGATGTRGLGSVADATLRAIDEAIGRDGTFELRSIALIDLRGTPSVCVNLVRAVEPERMLVGGAYAGDEDARGLAAARATLDAVNRQL